MDSEGAYFEVEVKQTRAVMDDGLTIGVTTQLPSALPEPHYQTADEVPVSWSIGFDGSVFSSCSVRVTMR